MSALRRITDKPDGRNAQSMHAPAALLFAGAMLAGGLSLAGCQKKDEAQTAGRPTPSGLPVPRYVSLRFATVNARGGPGDDYKLVWVYRTKGLPVQVVAETPDWRKVCDPQGGVAWVHKRTLDSKRAVMRLDRGELPMRKRATEEAPQAATLVANGVATLDRCAEGWCKVAAGGAEGWVKAADVWGTGDGVQCGDVRPETSRKP